MWFYDPIGKAPAYGECEEIYNGNFGLVYIVRIKSRQLVLFYTNEVFPTREALCEHYRKIFE